jgi:hypothetical protein
MGGKHRLFILALLTLILPACLIGCAGYGTTVHTHERFGNYIVELPVSKLRVFIPQNEFVQKDPKQFGNNHPQYFYFVSRTRNIILSGWFIPAEKFPGVHQFWEDEIKNFAQHGAPKPEDVVFEKNGKWEVILYDIQNSASTNSHARAQWVQAGTWIDMHLSITTNVPSSTARSTLMDVLNIIKVETYW